MERDTAPIVKATQRGQADADAKMQSILRVCARRGIEPGDYLADHAYWARAQRNEFDRSGCQIEFAYLCGYAATASDFGPTNLG